MKLAAALVVLAGCTDADTFPILTPSFGPPGGTPVILIGRVCLLADAQILTACAITGAGNLVVSLGSATTLTRVDGTFAITTPVVTPTFIRVSGNGIVTSLQPITAANIVPVMTNSLFNDLVLATGISLTSGTGSVLTSVVSRGGTPMSGVTATSTPSPAFGPFFDGTQPAPWQLNATGARGIVFFPGVSAGPAALTFTDLSTAGETTVDGVQVVDGGLTFVDAVLP